MGGAWIWEIMGRGVVQISMIWLYKYKLFRIFLVFWLQRLEKCVLTSLSPVNRAKMSQRSQHMNAKYKAKSLKRKREMEEKNQVEEEVPSKPPALTNAERMKRYRLRKKLSKAANDGNADPTQRSVSVDPEPVTVRADAPTTGANVMPEPMPGRSIDPVMFENIPQYTPSFHGE